MHLKARIMAEPAPRRCFRCPYQLLDQGTQCVGVDENWPGPYSAVEAGLAGRARSIMLRTSFSGLVPNRAASLLTRDSVSDSSSISNAISIPFHRHYTMAKLQGQTG